MTKYSFRTRMMILILSPTVLLGLLLGASFMVNHYHKLEKQVINAGTNIIQPLAVASEYAMTFKNRDVLRQLINSLHRQHSDIIKSIAVFNADGTLFVTSNYHYHFFHLRLPKNTPIPKKLMLTHLKNGLVLRMPITSKHNLFRLLRDLPKKNRLQPVLGYIAIDLDLQSARLQQWKELLILGLLLSFCLCIAMLFVYRLICDVTGLIHNMVDTVDRISRGDLNSRVEGKMLGELNILKNGINSMAMSLSAYHQQMQESIDQATSDLRKTLEQMEIQNIELERAEKKAQEAAQIKSEFLANMSHELRTPLNAVIGFARQTLKTFLTPTQTDYVQTIERSAHNLLSIINDILDFSKLDANKLILEHIPFQLRENLDEVMILLAHSAHEKGLELILKIHNEVPYSVIGDPMRFQQIITNLLANLLGNAIKFTEKGSIIVQVAVLSKEETAIRLMVEIRDPGKGIPPEQQAQLFEAFLQADASISRCHGGTGLGLAITKKLVKEMNGEIDFFSELNKGSTFSFNIKLNLDQAITDLSFSMDALNGKKLAYIENNPAVAEVTLDILGMTPLKVTYSSSLKDLPGQDYDFVLIGVPIPFRDNKAQHKNKLMTAMTLGREIILALPGQAQVDAEQLKKWGAKGCLIKPISPLRLFPLLLEEKIFEKKALSEPALQEASKTPSSRLPFRVMAVDDNAANLKLIGTLLEELVEETILCSSGEEALSIAGETPCDVILMDIQMPKMDGIRASELIRQLPLHRHTPIIAVTAHTTQGQAEHLLASGMTDYLAKPINEACLIQAIERHGNKKSAFQIPTLPALMEKEVPLDWELALQQAAYKKDLACDLLRMLLEQLPDVKKQIQDILDENGDEKKEKGGEEKEAGILSLIHRLHGSAAYSGVPRLKRICCTIEQALHKKTPLKELEPEWFELLDEIDEVTVAAETHLSDLLQNHSEKQHHDEAG